MELVILLIILALIFGVVGAFSHLFWFLAVVLLLVGLARWAFAGPRRL